ncbi:hypothetical protein L2E82_39090 [Cichorium intybus]|uniref:Uncharacterized protein n=1 Tax=Cichorium intybus TaxID=13427 RepID=A0ACB9ALL6_CICIN|nr:hypothetical protein L2E82_39090 [Cichorium intybus]
MVWIKDLMGQNCLLQCINRDWPGGLPRRQAQCAQEPGGVRPGAVRPGAVRPGPGAPDGYDSGSLNPNWCGLRAMIHMQEMLWYGLYSHDK